MSEELLDQSTVVENVDVVEDSDLEKKIAELTNRVAQEQERALWARADFENFRKRKDAEVDAFRQYANEKMIGEFLPIVDSFDRAMASFNDPSIAALVEGVQLIHKQLITTLEKLGVTAFDSLNTPFDTTVHMAVSEEEVEGVVAGTVVKEFQRGYKLQDRVIRPAMVVVAK